MACWIKSPLVPWSTGMIFGAACISRAIVPDRSGSARRRVNKVLRAARRRGGKVSPRIARRIHNPSPFVQTHTARPACRGRIRDNPAMSRLNALRRRRARSRLLKAASPCSTRRCRKSCPAKGTDRGWHMAFRSVATRWKKGDREVPLHVFLRRPTPGVRRTPRRLIEHGRDARAHSA